MRKIFSAPMTHDSLRSLCISIWAANNLFLILYSMMNLCIITHFRRFGLKNVRDFTNFLKMDVFLCGIYQQRLFRFDFFGFNSVKFY